jgi:hypothetical protein
MPPDTLLQEVIEGLQRGTQQGVRSAQLALLTQGPLVCSEALLKELDKPKDVLGGELALLGMELLKFLRSLVLHEGQGLDPQMPITVYAPVTFTVALDPNGLSPFCFAQCHSTHDLVVQQLIILILMVGLPNIRACAAPDCPGPHLFVKTYRREYCSVRCQKRTLTRKARHAEREQAARVAARQQQRKAQRRG